MRMMIDNKEVTRLMIGEEEIDKVFIGEELVWVKPIPPPTDILIVEYIAKENITPDFNYGYTYSKNVENLPAGKYKITIRAKTRPTTISFWDKSSLISVSYMDLSNVITTNAMFNNCNLLESIVWGTDRRFRKITNMGSMFAACSKLKTVDLSQFDVENVTMMHRIFADCSLLDNISMENWNTNRVTNMHTLFQNCRALKTIKLNSFNTSKVTSCEYMFGGVPATAEITVGQLFTKTESDCGFTGKFIRV